MNARDEARERVETGLLLVILVVVPMTLPALMILEMMGVVTR